jgi:hypothetical protein
LITNAFSGMDRRDKRGESEESKQDAFLLTPMLPGIEIQTESPINP